MSEENQITLESVKNFVRQLTPNKDLLYIFQPYSVGDFFYTGGLSHAVQKRKNKRATVLICKDRMQNLGVTYENFEDIVYLPNDTMYIIQQYFYLTEDYEGDNYIYGHFHKDKQGRDWFIWDKNLNLIDRYKKNVFKIPMETQYAKPVVSPISEENIAELHKKYFIDKNKTVVITPYAYSSKQLDMRFWMLLVMKLTEKGYTCYTSVNKAVETEKAIPFTAPMTINFRELYYLSDKVKCFIGSRVGIFDFLALTDAKTVNINPYPKWLWDVTVLYPQFNNRTFYNAIDYMLPITEYLEIENVHAEIKLSHKHIPSENICYSHEEILNGILTEVEKI